MSNPILPDIPDSEIIQRLWRYGHFRNPDPRFADALNVTQDVLDKLTVEDEPVREALISYQEFFIDRLDELSLILYHARAAMADGDPGPATRHLLQEKRCGVPEFADRQEANWPTSCRNALTTAYRMSLRGVTDGELESIWLEALSNWNGSIDVTMTLDKSPEAMDTARIWARGKALPGSTLAWSFLAQNNCRARLEQAYDTTISWSSKMLVTTITHEVGHALGLPHQRDSSATMFPSITNSSMSRRGFPNATDLAACKRIGYTVDANPRPKPPGPKPEPPGPDPPQLPPGPGVLSGRITADGRTYDIVGVAIR